VSRSNGITDQEDTMSTIRTPKSQQPVLRLDDAFLAEPTVEETPRHRAYRYTLAAIRLSLGWIFLWAFMDKMWGLGHETPSAGAWINGGSPTAGFLGKATSGPFASTYQSIAGDTWADTLFMVGLAGIGIALILGVAMRIAAVAGALMTVLMWTAVLPPANNLFMDDHLIYAMVFVLLALTSAGRTLGLSRQWERLPIVNRGGRAACGRRPAR
jgi:thiosulfate dehydrogenase [quinone] large subunit